MKKLIYLVDEFLRAKIHAPQTNYAGIHTVSIHRENRTSLFDHPPARIEFSPIQLGQNPKLTFACGIKQNVWKKIKHPIVFEVFVKNTFGISSRLFRKEVNAEMLKTSGWQNFEVDLSKYGGRSIRLLFATSVPKGADTSYCWSVWGEPRIEHEVPDVKSPHASGKQPGHVILISSDALRPDFLGAYGNQEVQTPHCDQLARENILFTHARAQTASTLGSHVTMLFGRHPRDHKVIEEWGMAPTGWLSMPEHLRKNGYKTFLIPSELELVDERAGVSNLFDEVVTCIGSPAQDGSITTRLTLDLLTRQREKAFFWLEYFDTHPPVTPPPPYNGIYYQGDPEADENLYKPESLSKIHGTEVMQEFDLTFDALRQGAVDAFLLSKLEATAQAFRGAPGSFPDLAIHLQNLGPRSMMDMPIDQFASWLDGHVSALKNGTVPNDLIRWLEIVMPMIQDIDDDITSWLRGVRDYRYPISQYKGAISYFDSHIGKLVAYLKENDLYDQSTIVITSPHGEILDEHGIHFHHHVLTESCVRVPVIVKPPKGFASPRRVDGIFEVMDIFPTVVELLGLAHPEHIQGKSWAPNLLDGSPIPERDSFAINNSFTTASIVRGRYKFIKALKYHRNSESWVWNAGDKAFYDLSESPADVVNRLHEMPELASEMETRLELFLQNE